MNKLVATQQSGALLRPCVVAGSSVALLQTDVQYPPCYKTLQNGCNFPGARPALAIPHPTQVCQNGLFAQIFFSICVSKEKFFIQRKRRDCSSVIAKMARSNGENLFWSSPNA